MSESRAALAFIGAFLLMAALVFAVDPYATFNKTASPSSISAGDNASIIITITGAGQPLETTKPADVMLVIDRSGSMADVITNYLQLNHTVGAITTQSTWTLVQTFSVSPQSAFDVVINTSGTTHRYDLRIQAPSGTNTTANNIATTPYTTSFSSSQWQAGTWKVWMSNDRTYALAYDVTSEKVLSSMTKLDAAKNAANTFVDILNQTAQGGLDSFSTSATLDKQLALMTASNKTALKTAINALVASGSTDTGDGINYATTELTSVRARSNAVKFMVLMSDGQNNTGPSVYNAAQNAKNKSITIYTIGFGADADAVVLGHVADLTGGKYYYAPDAATLQQIYANIATEINTIAATSIYVSDVLSPYANFVGPVPSGCSYDAPTKTLSCYSGSLAINSSWVIQFEVSLNGVGPLPTNDNSTSSFNYTATNGSTTTGLLGSPVVTVGSGCQYSEWANDQCVGDGLMHQIRTDSSGYEYCTDLEQTISDPVCACQQGDNALACVSDGFRQHEQPWNYGYCGQTTYSNVADATCDCQASESSRACIQFGFANVSYDWNFAYCGSSYTQEEQDASCTSNYSCTDWTNVENQYGGCVENGVANQTRTCTDQYQNTYTEYQTASDGNCNCNPSEDSRTCSRDGYSDVTYKWNYGYCGEGYTQTESDSNCACQYSEWQNTECASDGMMQQTRTDGSGHNYCTVLSQQVENSQCGCQQTDTPLSCVSDAFKQHRYDWNYGYCGQTTYDNVADQSCACTSYETGRECISNGEATVSYGRNFEYCGQSYSQQEEDLSCNSNYSCTEWTNVDDQYNGCVENGVVNQTQTCTDQYDNSYVQYRTVENENCGCVASESGDPSRTCVSDGQANVSYTWNYPYCGEPYVLTQTSENCGCQYSEWQNGECVSDGLRQQTRQQTSEFEYCTDVRRQIEDSSCNQEPTPTPTPSPSPSPEPTAPPQIYSGGGGGGGEIFVTTSLPAPTPSPTPTAVPSPTPTRSPPAPSPTPTPKPPIQGPAYVAPPSPTPNPINVGVAPAPVTGLFAAFNSPCIAGLFLLALIGALLVYFNKAGAAFTGNAKRLFVLLAAVAFLIPFGVAVLTGSCSALPYAVGEDVVLLLLFFYKRMK